MRRRSLAAQVLSGAVVAVVMTVAAAVVYLAFAEGAAAIRAGQADRALKAGLVALVAAVVAVLALTAYGHWLAVTEPPVSRRRERAPSVPELVLAGLAVGVLVIAAWPILSLAYHRVGRAYESFDLARAVGWGVLAVAYVWFVVFSVEHFAGWLRRRGRLLEQVGSRPHDRPGDRLDDRPADQPHHRLGDRPHDRSGERPHHRRGDRSGGGSDDVRGSRLRGRTEQG